MAAIQLTEAEEGVCQDIVAGMDLLTIFRRNYPKDKRKDNKARHQVKIILKREKVADRVVFLQQQQNFDGTVTPEVIRARLWDWVNRFPGKNAGMASLKILAKDAGVGLDKIVIEDNTGLVDLQHNLFARRMARINGEEVPPMLNDVIEDENVKVLDEADYEIISNEGEEDEEDVMLDDSPNEYEEDDDDDDEWSSKW